MSYDRIAIPSYRRAYAIGEKTVPLLLARGIPAERIDVFLSDPGEAPEYEQALAGTGVNILEGAPTVRGNRAAINRHYPKGTRLVGIDDDITDVIERRSDKRKDLRSVADLGNLFSRAFTLADAERCTLWGIYPVANPLFMKPRATTDLRLIIGGLYGWTADPDAAHHNTVLEDKDDYERTVRHYLHDGRVLRINWIAPITPYYKGEGGMQATRTKERQAEAVQWMLDNYGDYCTRHTNTQSEYEEIKLKDRRLK